MNTITPISVTSDTVTLRRVDWTAILERLDDAADLEAVRRHEAKPEAQRVAYTATEIDRMLDDGVHALTIWRERRGMTQGDLATRAGVSQSYLSEIEGGKKPGSAAALRRIAQALDVQIEHLLA